jgi:omega-amidase
MQIIGCQFDMTWEDKPANFAKVRALLNGAKIEPRALIVLPEMFATGFSMNVAATAEARNGPTQKFLTQLAIDKQAFVIGGIVTANGDGRGRNEALVLDPQGKEIQRYCKLHPFSPSGENAHFARGDKTCAFNWGPFRVALFVCYDLRFPEIFRLQSQHGANLIVVIANWPSPRDSHWQALLKARAIENQAYVVGVNRVGKDPKLEYLGHSLIFDPRGETLAAAGEGEQLIEARIEVEPLLEFRQQFPVLADLRPEFLGDALLSEPRA